jgi:hypothetical protein
MPRTISNIPPVKRRTDQAPALGRGNKSVFFVMLFFEKSPLFGIPYLTNSPHPNECISNNPLQAKNGNQLPPRPDSRYESDY